MKVKPIVIMVALLSGCTRPAAPRLPAAPTDRPPPTQYVDVTQPAGLRFHHVNGAAGRRYFVETMGAGCAFLDYNNDGWLDLLLLNGRPLQASGSNHAPIQNPKSKIRNPTAALYRNNRDGTFTDVTRGSGLDVPLYAMGCCVGDYDNDGDEDIYVTCALEPARLFRNEGGGKFQDVTAPAGVGDRGKFGTSCAWLDYDNDGWLDLFVCNYVQYSLATDRPCYEGGKRYYCRPTVYKPDTCILYHNRGDGRFEDVTRPAGILNRTGNSLGVAIWDFDDDGWQDIAVANDLTPNYLFHNLGGQQSEARDSDSPPNPKSKIQNPKYEEVGLEWGLAFGEDARARAGMGIDVAEYRNDGRPAVLVSNFTGEPLSFFFRDTPGQFTDIAFQAGVGHAHLRFLGFGLFFFDYDNDGDADAFVGNGHIEPSISQFGGSTTYGQRNHLYRSRGDGSFEETGQSLGAPFGYERVTRGAAYGDYDNDGDLDILVTNNNQPAELLRNDGGNGRSWLQVELIGQMAGIKAKSAGSSDGLPERTNAQTPERLKRSSADGIGARVSVRTGTVTQRDFVRSGSSYCSQSMLRRHFGLGAAPVVDEIEVRWPSGVVDRLRNVKANQRLTIVEGHGKQP